MIAFPNCSYVLAYFSLALIIEGMLLYNLVRYAHFKLQFAKTFIFQFDISKFPIGAGLRFSWQVESSNYAVNFQYFHLARDLKGKSSDEYYSN